MKEIDNRRIDLTRQHYREASAMFARFLKSRPDIDPNFIDDMTPEQESDWHQYSSDLVITQGIERYELDIEIAAENQ